MPHLYYLEGRRWMRIYYLEPPTLGIWFQLQINVHQLTTSSTEDKKLYLRIHTCMNHLHFGVVLCIQSSILVLVFSKITTLI